MSTTIPAPAPASPAQNAVYRFVGGHTMILGVDELKEFGQKITLTPEAAETVLRGGGLILPDATFATFFTPAEMAEKTFPKFPGHWFNASDDLKAKKKAAEKAAVELHYAAVKREDDARINSASAAKEAASKVEAIATAAKEHIASVAEKTTSVAEKTADVVKEKV